MLGVIAGLAEVVGGGANPRAPAKLKIIVESGGKLDEKAALPVPHMFNPVDLKVTRKANWGKHEGQKADGTAQAHNVTFCGADDSLTFTVNLDASEEAEVDLRKELEALYDLTYPFVAVEGIKDAKRAPVVRVEWNDFKFTGVVKNVDATVTLFDPKGRFKRAQVVLSFEGFAYEGSISSTADYFNKPRNKKKAAAPDKAPAFGSGNPLSSMGF